ncbi:MAG TPA: hypothetical protein VN878_01905 [Usitatibacter sp.]|nr:hypothetical protein [Usitatibacter sp.]
MIALNSWCAQALRRIGAFFNRAADYLDQPQFAPALLEPVQKVARIEDFISDVRWRMQNRSY